jgi:predicted ribosome quality control (RQC) complex YloA/Tae2 family protein
MDIFVIQSVARELNAGLVGERIQKIYQPTRNELLLVCGAPGRGARRLIMSADPVYPRIHLTQDETPAPAEPTDFCLSLRNHLLGARISGISAGRRERVVQISLEKFGLGGAHRWYALMAEIMGRWSNIVLVNAQSGEITDSIRQVSETQSRERPLARNARYRLPPEQKKIRPDSVDEAQFIQMIPGELIPGEKSPESGPGEISRWLVRSFAGVSPGVASEIAAQAAQASETGWSALWRVFSAVLGDLRDGKVRPAVLLDSRGAPEGLSPLEPRTVSPERRRIFETMNEAADFFFRGSIPPSDFAGRKAAAARELGRHSSRVTRTLKAIGRDIDNSRGADLARLKGEILLENLDRVEEKTSLYRAGHADGPIDIALDPRYSASENAQRYFRRYKKMQRQAVIAGQRKKAMEEELSFLGGLSFDLDEAEEAEDLAAVREALAQGGFKTKSRSDKENKRPRKGRRQNEAVRRSRSWRRFQAAEGWQIFLGKSALGNDALLREIGRSGDLWFHAQGVPGSHVLLRIPNEDAEETAPDEAILQAAVLAAYHSRGRGNTRQNVDYLPFRRLRRPRRSRPGQVIFTGQNTIAAPPDDAPELMEILEEIQQGL